MEPDDGQLVLASSILITGKSVLSDMPGASARAQSDQTINLYTPDAGLFTFALQPFPGAVQGEANWGMLTFEIDKQKYSLRSASPICGGGQPHAVWVKLDAAFSPREEGEKRGFLGCSKLSEAAAIKW